MFENMAAQHPVNRPGRDAATAKIRHHVGLETIFLRVDVTAKTTRGTFTLEEKA